MPTRTRSYACVPGPRGYPFHMPAPVPASEERRPQVRLAQRDEGFGRALNALTHYAPVDGTLAGEALRQLPLPGCDSWPRRAGASLAPPGHAHVGALEGETPGGFAVRNIAQPVFGRSYKVFELHDGRADGVRETILSG